MTTDVFRSARLMASVLAIGCADRRQTLVLSSTPPPEYRAGCGDVFRVRFAGRPGLDGVGCVAADGLLPLGPLGGVPADRHTMQEIQQAAAVAAGVRPEDVSVELTTARSAVVYLRTPTGRLAPMPYLGTETVARFLWRAGFTVVGRVSVSRPDLSGGPTQRFEVPTLDLVMVEPGDVVTIR